MKEKYLSNEWYKLILYRYKKIPDNCSILINREYSKDEIINHIKRKDEIYELLCKVEEEYFRALKDGSLTKYIMENQ